MQQMAQTRHKSAVSLASVWALVPLFERLQHDATRLVLMNTAMICYSMFCNVFCIVFYACMSPVPGPLPRMVLSPSLTEELRDELRS